MSFSARIWPTLSHSQFAGPWWFRKEISLSQEQSASPAELIFEGINYRANVWLNGQCLASTNEIFGAFRMFPPRGWRPVQTGE